MKTNNQNSNKNYVVRTVQQSQMQYPKLVEQKSADANYVLNGTNHKYVKFLNELYQKSATHRAMIKTKANMTAGHKVIYNQDLSVEEIAVLENWFKNINQEGDSLHDIITSLALDFHIFGYCFIQVGYNKLKEPNYINHIDATTIAVGKTNKEGKIDNYYFSNDWSNYKKEEFKPISLNAFNPDNVTPGKTQILMIKAKEPGLVYYSAPTYDETTMLYALQEYDLAKFHLNNTNNGFFPSALITHYEPGMNEQQQDDVIDSFEHLYTGTQQKKLVHLFINDKDLTPKVEPFPSNDDDEKFLELNKICESKIAIGHMIVNKALAGLTNESGALGDRTSIQDSFELLLKNTIRPVQKLIEKGINKVIQVKVPSAQIYIMTESPLQFKAFSENILSQVMTQAEIRNELGLQPLKNNEQTNLDTVRSANPDLNNGQAVYPGSILEQDSANA